MFRCDSSFSKKLFWVISSEYVSLVSYHTEDLGPARLVPCVRNFFFHSDELNFICNSREMSQQGTVCDSACFSQYRWVGWQQTLETLRYDFKPHFKVEWHGPLVKVLHQVSSTKTLRGSQLSTYQKDPFQCSRTISPFSFYAFNG